MFKYDMKKYILQLMKILTGVSFMILILGMNHNMVEAETVEKTCGYYTYVEDQRGVWIVGYDDGKDYYETEDENLTWNIPSTLDGLKVIGIGDYHGEDYETDCSFGIKYYVSKITLPDTLLYIGSNAFSESKKLESITIPSGLKEICSWAFYGCENLKNITIPEGLNYIGAHAFNGCKSLEVVNIPSSVTSIGNYAFFDCWSAKGIYVADGNSYYFDLDGVLCTYKYIDENGEPYSTEIYVITYPGGKSGTFNIESNMYIDETTFVNAKSLSGITVDSVHTDYSSAEGILYNKDKTEIKICPCAKTGTITIPDTVTKIGYSAFSYSSATEIVIPDSVTFVDSYAFYNCKDLKKLTIGKNIINRQEEYYYNNSADYLLEQLSTADALTDIVISSENSYMKVIDGIVYNNDITEILFCPVKRSGAYVMPDTVVSSTPTIFCRGFSEMTIGAAFTNTISEYSEIEKYYVSDGNTKYSAKDGWLYSKDQKTIIRFPAGMNGDVTIPNGVTGIEDGTVIIELAGTVTIPESVIEIDGVEYWHNDTKDYTVTIYGYKNSYAEKFASEYNIPFVVINKDDKPEEQIKVVPTTKQVVESVSLKGISKKIAAGKKIKLSATIVPADAANQKLTWKSSNVKYATVSSNGLVTTKKKGAGKTVTISATTKDGSDIVATYKIKIVKHAVKSVKITAKSKTVKAGKKLSLKAHVKTTGKTANKTLTWSSSNKKYAAVSQKGVVKTTKQGKGKTVKITAKATDGTGKKAVVRIRIR